MHTPISDLLLKLVSGWGRVFFPQGGCTESQSQSDSAGQAFVLSTRGHLFLLPNSCTSHPICDDTTSKLFSSAAHIYFLVFTGNPLLK